jgi:hypothetical protein
MRHQRTASEGSEAASQELFRARLDALIDLSHPLSRLMPWEAIENAVSGVFPVGPASCAADPVDGGAFVPQACLQPLGRGDV